MKLLDLCIKHDVGIETSKLLTRDAKTSRATYHLLLRKGDDRYIQDGVTYNCGSYHYASRKAIDALPGGALFGYATGKDDAERLVTVGRKSIDGQALLAELAKRYIPDIEDVVGSLLLDYSGAKDHVDWLSWAHEYELLKESTVQQLREYQTTFVKIHERGRTLREWFGDDYDEAMKLAQEM